MGDIWPYEPPRFTTWQNVRGYMESLGVSANDAAVFAAIATAEASLDLSVINDTPATGDYSVGTFQINYFGNLYAGRASEFGTPRQLVLGGLGRQAHAALGVWHGQGFSAWSTFTSGAYRQYLHGARAPAGGPGGGGPLPPVNTTISPPTEDYSGTIKKSAVLLTQTGNTF